MDILWGILWINSIITLHDVWCTAARNSGSAPSSSSSRSGSAWSYSNSRSVGFVGGPDPDSPFFIIAMTIFGCLVLAVIIFLFIMWCTLCSCCWLHKPRTIRPVPYYKSPMIRQDSLYTLPAVWKDTSYNPPIVQQEPLDNSVKPSPIPGEALYIEAPSNPVGNVL